MRISGEAEVAAARADLWALLLDPVRVAACVPGVEEVDQVGPSSFTGAIRASVGPLSGRFAFQASIEETEPPARLTARIEGTDDISRSTVRTTLVLSLDAPDPLRTRLRHDATVDVEGRLAIIGDMILRATAAAMFGQFVRRVGDELGRSPTGGPAGPA
jgi:carbon monoxide dehydrogenase subunit G